MIPLSAGWLDDLTNWLRGIVHSVWDAFVLFLHDAIISMIASVLDLAATAIEAIPVPSFLTTYSLDSILGAAGPTIGWVMGTFRIGEGLAVVAAGFGFRLLRKLFTLGQW